MAAQDFVSKTFDGKLQITGLYRVWFDDPETCTTWKDADIDPVRPDILAVELNFRYIALFADLGCNYLPILLDFRDKDIRLSEAYGRFEWIKKASAEDLKEICDEVASRFEESKSEYRAVATTQVERS